MPKLIIDITDELSGALLSARVDAVDVCLTALSKAISKSDMIEQQETRKTRKPGRPLASDTGDKLVWRSVGLDPATWDRVTAAAAAAGVTSNEFLRQIVMKATQD